MAEIGYTKGVKLRLWNFRQWLLFGLMFVAVAVLVWFGDKLYFNYRQYSGRPESHEVQGQLKRISPDSLDVTGVHVFDIYPQNSDFTHPQPLRVKIAPDTKFVRTIWYMPTKAELAKTKGMWYPDKLKKEQQVGSIIDPGLVQGISLTIKTSNNSIRDKVIKASEVDYVVRQYPH